jgi:catechol 2,3-dioxygenase-like lactoylglutathione lyase family enzyme
MSRVQLALNVADIDAAVDFYGKLFGAEPAKRRPGYANFAIAEPPLKLVLIEDKERGEGVTGALNHLGVEVESPTDVAAATARLNGEDLDTLVQEGTACCYAVQDKVPFSPTHRRPTT